MNSYNEISARECATRLLKLGRTAVLTHARPDGDTVGSASALVLILRSLGADAALLCPDKIPDRLSFLTENVPICESAEGRECISIDVASRTQLGSLSELDVRLMIDHHAKATPYADVYSVATASSAAEVLLDVTDELKALTDFKMTAEIAARIYAAMSSDTGCFRYSNAGAKTLRRAAELIELGIDFADINHRLFNSKTQKELQAEGFIASRIKTDCCGRIAYATLPKHERDTLGIGLEYFETAVDIIRSLKGAEIAIFVRENDDGALRASLRSTGFNVAEIAAKFSGGGHIRAAGCSPVASGADEAAAILINEIKKTI